MELTKEDLEKLLREAEKAHGEYEQKLGQRDDNWPSWYAEFIVKKLRERERGKLTVVRFIRLLLSRRSLRALSENPQFPSKADLTLKPRPGSSVSGWQPEVRRML